MATLAPSGESVPAAQRPRYALPLLALAAFVLAVLLRLVALTSDPYLRLDWSAGLLTDEGFYIHNARNVALFGYARTDDFNNMLLSPLLHYAQVGVFQLFGTGSAQARLISAASSLLTLVLFYAALRRAFGHLDSRIAVTGTLFLALDHTNLLFNRMALMDTPAAMLAVAAFYAFVRGVGARGGRPRTVWFAVAGSLLGLTVVGRMLCAYLIPVPFLALWLSRRSGSSDESLSIPPFRRTALIVGLSLAGVLALYVAFWYLPNRGEIAPMNQYYRTHQIQPRSVTHLLQNVQHAVCGDHRGVAPYLFRHTPILFLLAMIGVLNVRALAGGRTGRHADESLPPSAASAVFYLAAWLALGWLLLATISYSPSRYYVTTYPALAGLAAITVWRLPGRLDMGRAAAALVTGFVLFHAVLSVVHYGGVLPPAATVAVLYGVPVAGAASVFAGWTWLSCRMRVGAAHLAAAAIAAWLVVNAAWLGDWARHINYSQVQTSRWLAGNLPVGSVLIGDVAPGLSLDNRFTAVHVQPGLANDVQPVERFAGMPRYILILDGRWKERYWLQRYPELVAPERRIKLAHVLRWDVGVYSVDEPESHR